MTFREAIHTAAQLGMVSCLSIHFMPNAIYWSELWIQSTLRAAPDNLCSIKRVIFEMVEPFPRRHKVAAQPLFRLLAASHASEFTTAGVAAVDAG